MEIRNVLSDSPVTSVGNMPSDLTFHLPDLLFKNYFVLIICLSVDTNPHCLPGGHMCPHVNFLFLCIWRVWCRIRAHVLTQCVNLSLSNMWVTKTNDQCWACVIFPRHHVIRKGLSNELIISNIGLTTPTPPPLYWLEPLNWRGDSRAGSISSPLILVLERVQYGSADLVFSPSGSLVNYKSPCDAVTRNKRQVSSTANGSGDYSRVKIKHKL